MSHLNVSHHAFIDLSSISDDDDGPWPADVPVVESSSVDLRGPPENQAPHGQNRRGEVIVIDGEDVFIPDEHLELDDFKPPAVEAFTTESCLARVLAIFPNIDHAYARTLYDNQAPEVPASSRLEQIIEQLVSGEEYPKQEKGKQKKRKREDGENGDDVRWEHHDRDLPPMYCRSAILAMLKADFPEFPRKKIEEELHKHTHLYQTYTVLAQVKDGSQMGQKWRGRAPQRHLADAVLIATASGSHSLLEELEAARQKVKSIRTKRKADEEKKIAELENLQRAMAHGELAECQACFEELPMNRQAHCDGDTPHFTCLECLEVYVKSEVGQSRCNVLCTAGCGAPFAHVQLHCLADKELIIKLEQLQQEKAIRDAGIEDLEECPFCEYKAILPPVEVDFEFRCANPECEKVSCRRCMAVSHTPLSCQEYAKDKRLNSRHVIEEAMTAALVRSCNNCKKQFIKEYGCNKMSCTSCGNLQCYVCSQSVRDYGHFSRPEHGAQKQAGKCPLIDDVEERHEREVKEAEAAARRQILEENPDISEADIDMKILHAVGKASQNRTRQMYPFDPQRLMGFPGGLALPGQAPFVIPALDGHRFPFNPYGDVEQHHDNEDEDEDENEEGQEEEDHEDDNEGQDGEQQFVDVVLGLQMQQRQAELRRNFVPARTRYHRPSRPPPHAPRDVPIDRQLQAPLNPYGHIGGLDLQMLHPNNHLWGAPGQPQAFTPPNHFAHYPYHDHALQRQADWLDLPNQIYQQPLEVANGVAPAFHGAINAFVNPGFAPDAGTNVNFYRRPPQPPPPPAPLLGMSQAQRQAYRTAMFGYEREQGRLQLQYQAMMKLQAAAAGEEQGNR